MSTEKNAKQLARLIDVEDLVQKEGEKLQKNWFIRPSAEIVRLTGRVSKITKRDRTKIARVAFLRGLKSMLEECGIPEPT